MSQVLKYYRSRISGGSNELATTIEDFSTLKESLEQADSVEALMAIEGHCREKYYATFDFIINNPDFPFERRSQRPPHNRLNALISFGNSICYTVALSEIYKTYLDPRIGYLHATNFRRFSLNLDVAEIFKPIMVDRLIFTLLNKKMLTKKDFDKHVDGIILTEGGRKKFIAELDNRLKTTVNHRHLGRAVSYRRLMRLELYKIQKHIMGEKPYVPYQSLW
jgi:CRISPR-associated protein Cas1